MKRNAELATGNHNPNNLNALMTFKADLRIIEAGGREMSSSVVAATAAALRACISSTETIIALRRLKSVR